MKTARWAAIGMIMGTLGACGSDGGSSGPDCNATDAPTYETFGQAFMGEYCTGCHASSLEGDARGQVPEDVNLDTLAGVRAVSDNIVRVAVESDQMPMGSGKKPSDEERALLGQWLSCGAP